MVNLNLVSSRKIFFQATPPLKEKTGISFVLTSIGPGHVSNMVTRCNSEHLFQANCKSDEVMWNLMKIGLMQEPTVNDI